MKQAAERRRIFVMSVTPEMDCGSLRPGWTPKGGCGSISKSGRERLDLPLDGGSTPQERTRGSVQPWLHGRCQALERQAQEGDVDRRRPVNLRARIPPMSRQTGRNCLDERDCRELQCLALEVIER